MFGKKKKDDLGGYSPSEAIKREAQLRQQKLKNEISRCAVNVATFENTMNRKLHTAVNKALDAKMKGNATAMRNAYIDIRMALKFLGLAKGMASVMTRLESNVEFSRLAQDMGEAIKGAGSLTKQNPHIEVQQLDELYNRAVAPVNKIMEQMEQFNDLSVSQPFDDYSISDDEVERVIKQVISNPTASFEPPAVFTQTTSQPVVQNQPTEQQPSANSVDAMIKELNDLARKLQ